MLKKIAALVLSIALCLSLVSFAVAEDVPNLANTYYSYGYDVGTMFMNYYFHFYDEIPGLGKVFHAGMCMDQICFDGTYEVIAEERAYSVAMDRAASEAGTLTEGKAPYTIVFYDFAGNELDRFLVCFLSGFFGGRLVLEEEKMRKSDGFSHLLAILLCVTLITGNAGITVLAGDYTSEQGVEADFFDEDRILDEILQLFNE